MKAQIFFLSVSVAGQAIAATPVQVQCTFPESNVTLNFPAFQSGCKRVGDSSLEIKMEEKGTEKQTKASLTGMSRGSAVTSDLKDKRPAALVTLTGSESHRLAIYYCAGDGQTVEAKLFTGRPGAGSADFISNNVTVGSCTGKDLTRALTNDCSAYK